MSSEIYLAGGCFWGMEKYLSLIEGVESTQVGYANGNKLFPTYEEVCNNSGHAETVKVVYNPEEITLKELLNLYFEAIDPTSLNKQGGDTGIQYRTGIYYIDENDLPVIKQAIDELQKKYDKPVVIEVEPLRNYSPAEEYHQKYLEKNPGGYCHISSELFKKVACAKPSGQNE